MASASSAMARGRRSPPAGPGPRRTGGRRPAARGRGRRGADAPRRSAARSPRDAGVRPRRQAVGTRGARAGPSPPGLRGAHSGLGEGGRGGLDRPLHVLRGVRERGEPRLELRRRRIDAARQQRAAPRAVGVGVAGLGALVVAHGRLVKKTVTRPAPTATWTGRSPAGVAQPAASWSVCTRAARRPLVEHLERRAAGGDGERVPAQRAGLVDVAGRRDALHQLLRAAVGRGGQPAADDLAHHGQVRQHAGELLRAAVRHAEARDDPRRRPAARRVACASSRSSSRKPAPAGRGPCWPGRARTGSPRTRVRDRRRASPRDRSRAR